MEESSVQVSEFNENALKIQRLHNCWLESARHRHNGNLLACKWILDTAECELLAFARKIDESQGQDTKGNGFVGDLEESNKKVNKEQTKTQFYQALLNREKLLRQIQQEIGMGTTFRNYDDDEMD